MHLLYLARVLWQVCLILSPIDDIFVVRPSYLLVGQKVVAGLLLLTFNLLLQAGRYVREALLTDAVLAP